MASKPGPAPEGAAAASRTTGAEPSTENSFLYRKELVPQGGPVFFDVEKLSLKKASADARHEMMASSIAVVNRSKDVILWSLIKWNDANVCQTFPTITGINRQTLKQGLTLDVVKPYIDETFNRNLVVGYALGDDLKSLGSSASKTLDLSNYFVEGYGLKRKRYKLKDVWEHFFCGDEIQSGAHSALQDAIATRDIYFKYLELVKKYPDFNRYPVRLKRSPKQVFQFDPTDRCRCPK